MKTAVLDSFLKFYVMISTQVDLFGIYHVKVHFIAHQKMYVIPMLGRFVWTTILYNVKGVCDVIADSSFFLHDYF